MEEIRVIETEQLYLFVYLVNDLARSIKQSADSKFLHKLAAWIFVGIPPQPTFF